MTIEKYVGDKKNQQHFAKPQDRWLNRSSSQDKDKWNPPERLLSHGVGLRTRHITLITLLEQKS